MLALRVVHEGEAKKLNVPLHPDYNFLKSEIAYACKHELAEKAGDIIFRRIPIAFLNKEAAKKVLPEVVEIMAKEKKWSGSKKKAELEEALKNLDCHV